MVVRLHYSDGTSSLLRWDGAFPCVPQTQMIFWLWEANLASLVLRLTVGRQSRRRIKLDVTTPLGEGPTRSAHGVLAD